MALDSQPVRLSPLHHKHHELEAEFTLQGGWLIPIRYPRSDEKDSVTEEKIGLIDISAQGKLTVKGAHSSRIISTLFENVPMRTGEVQEIRSTGILISCLTEDEFIILTFPGEEKQWADSLTEVIDSANAFVTLIDQTSGLVGLSIVGVESSTIMSKLCALPFHSKAFPDHTAAQGSFAKLRATIIRHDQDHLPAFEIFADRSYSDYLWDTVLDAGQEFGINPAGWEAVSELR